MTQVSDPRLVEKSGQAMTQREAHAAVLLYAFRPMFLAAGSWAVIALALWLMMFFGYLQLPTRFDPISWHIHEMLFGFVMAAITGFLLTAIPNWTGRLPVRGFPLAALAGLWVLGRLACLISADLPAWLAVTTDLVFPTTVLFVAAREIVAGHNWHNLPMTAPLAVFLIADLLMHLESLGWSVPVGLGWRLALAAPIILISAIGGRIIPSFTRNWLFKRKSPHLPSSANHFDKACVAVLAIAFTGTEIVYDCPGSNTDENRTMACLSPSPFHFISVSTVVTTFQPLASFTQYVIAEALALNSVVTPWPSRTVLDRMFVARRVARPCGM